MATLEALRGKLPELSGLDDEHAIEFIRRVYYPDRQPAEIAASLGYKSPPPEAKPRNGFAVTNDTVIDFANAAAGGIGAAANFVSPGNRVSKYIDENIVAAGKAKQSDATRAEDARYAAEMEAAQGFGDEVGTTLGYVARNPLRSVAQAAGSFVGPGASVKAMQLAARGLGAGAAGITRAGLAGGAMAGGAMAGGDAAGTAYELAIKAGATEEEATAAARQASMIPGAIGAAGGLVGAERVFAGGKGFAGGRMSRALKTGAVEAGQEGIEEGVTQYEGQRAAMPFDPNIDPMKGVGGAATMGAVLGGITGGSLAAMSPGDQLRTEGLQPERGPATRALNAAVEAAAKKVDVNPALGWNQLYEPEGGFNGREPMYVFQDGSAATRDEAAQVIAGNIALQNIEQWVARSPRPMPQPEAESLAQAASQKTGQPMAPLPLPDGSGWTVVPQAWVNTPAIADYMEQATAANAVEQERQQRIAEIQSAPVDRAPRERAPEAAPPAPAADLVATYVDQRRNDGTPAGRAFAQDFDAGRITRADVQGLIDTARPQSADDRLAAAAAQAPKPQALQPGDLLNPKGEPFRNQRAATTTAQREGGSVIVVDGGWAVRKATDAPATAAAAGPRDADTGRSDGAGVLRDQRPDDVSVGTGAPAEQGTGQPGAAALGPREPAQPAPALRKVVDLKGEKQIRETAKAIAKAERDEVLFNLSEIRTYRQTGSLSDADAQKAIDALRGVVEGGDFDDAMEIVDPILSTAGKKHAERLDAPAANDPVPAPALSPDADLPTLKKAWSEAAAAGDTERAREINDRIVALKKAPATTATTATTAVSVRELALQEQRDAGWDTNWPFVPADLGNADFRQLLRDDPGMSADEKARIFKAGHRLGVVPAAEAVMKAAPKAAQVESDSTPAPSSTGQAPVKQTEAAPAATAVSVGGAVERLGRVMRSAGWEINHIDMDLTAGQPKADIRITRGDGRFIVAKVDGQGRATMETFQRTRSLGIDPKNKQARLAPQIDDQFLGRQKFEGARSMLRGVVTYLSDNATNPVALADMKAAWAGVMSGPTTQGAAMLPAPDPAASVAPVKGSKKAAEIKAKRAAKLNPAPVAPESAAATTEGAANGDQAQEEAQGLLSTSAPADVTTAGAAEGPIKRPPKSFRKKVKVKTDVFVEETGSFEQREIDAEAAMTALDEDIKGLLSLRACIAGGVRHAGR